MNRRIFLVTLLAWAGFGLGLEPARAEEGFFVQIASVKSKDRAEAAWEQLKQSHPDLLGDLDATVLSADLGDRGIFFRIRTGPFPNQATAQDMCWQIKAEKLGCLVVRGE